MNEWLDRAAQAVSAGEPATLVSVAGVRGSAPREVGARMLVSCDETLGTIGGGQLEYQCARIGWNLLNTHGERPAMSLRKFPLGADCGQCCGGVVDVLFEKLTAASAWVCDLRDARNRGIPAAVLSWSAKGGELRRAVVTNDDALPKIHGAEPVLADIVARARADGKARRADSRLGSGPANFLLVEPFVSSGFNIAVFGAGHVGSAIVAVLATLDADVRWIDSRPGILPERTPGNVQTLSSAEPAREVAALPGNSFFFVLTHSHPLDYEICRAVLARDDFAYLGLIGSRSKRRRFEKRFAREGLPGVDRMTCPIGIAGISGKKPAEIALAAVAQVLQLREATAAVVESGKVRRLSRHVR